MEFVFKEHCGTCGQSVVSEKLAITPEGFDQLVKSDSSYDHGTEKASGSKVVYRKMLGTCPSCLAVERKNSMAAQVIDANNAAKWEACVALATHVFERVCGGDAAGGGCGAPGGVITVSRQYFDTFNSKVFSCLQEHNDDEVDSDIVQAAENGRLRLKLVFSPCSSCHRL